MRGIDSCGQKTFSHCRARSLASGYCFQASSETIQQSLCAEFSNQFQIIHFASANLCRWRFWRNSDWEYDARLAAGFALGLASSVFPKWLETARNPCQVHDLFQRAKRRQVPQTPQFFAISRIQKNHNCGRRADRFLSGSILSNSGVRFLNFVLMEMASIMASLSIHLQNAVAAGGGRGRRHRHARRVTLSPARRRKSCLDFRRRQALWRQGGGARPAPRATRICR